MMEWPKKEGEKHGWHWVMRAGVQGRHVRHVTHDTNHWKTFVAERCSAKSGERGSMTVFGTKPEQHRLLMDHLAAETCVKTFGRGREVWEWKMRPGQDNHWLDTLCGASVAASMCGAALGNLQKTPPRIVKATTPNDYAERRRQFEMRRGY